MDFFKLINTRESCRCYSDATVSREQLNFILEAGRLSPSACNTQPWHFYAVSGEKVPKMRLAVQASGRNKFTDKTQAFIVVAGEKPVYPEAVGKAVNGKDYSSYDIGLAVANMTLAATSIGLGTCILGVFDEEMVKAACGIDKESGKTVHLVISVGCPATLKPREKTRKSALDVYTFVD